MVRLVVSELSIDFETRSVVDLKKAGVYRYAEDPSTDVWCMAWAFGDEEPEIWTPDMVEYNPTEGGFIITKLPMRIVEHIAAGGVIRAWNAQFERIIWREIMVKRYAAPAVALEQWVCSAAEAAAMALPRHLGGAAHVLRVTQQKDDSGYRLMLRMARPRATLRDGTVVWWDEAGSRALAVARRWSRRELEKDLEDVVEKQTTLRAYCNQDVRTERSIVPALRRLTPLEREVYLLDQRTNDRGVRLDLELVLAAERIVDEGVTRANARLDDLTNGAVSKVSNNGRLLQWLNANDVDTDSVGKPALAALMERDDLAANVEEVLTLRATAGRSSVAKLKSMLDVMCEDGQLRGLLLYHAASTGRWGGRLVQPQNFPRGEVDDIESYIDLVHAGDYDMIDLIHPPIIVVLSMLRSMITARPGHELVAGDFSAIEARVLNWLAGQADVVESFRQYDLASKEDKPKWDPYRRMAVKMGRGTAPELVTKEDRQAGKAAELGCGFQMGWEKFITAAWTVYQVRVNEEQAQAAVSIYRESHPKVKQSWRDSEDACMAAVREPNTMKRFGANGILKAIKRGGYLYIILPSGRPLCYASPRVKPRPMPWCDLCGKKDKDHGHEGQDHRFLAAMKDTLHFRGVDPFTKQWGELSAYGGLLMENITQAVARDLMAEGMLRLEKAGYPPVLSVHDEVVAEVLHGFGELSEFERLLATTPDWAKGCPVAAEGWRGFRYRK